MLTARDCTTADGQLITEAMIELGHWQQVGPECLIDACDGRLIVKTEKNRLRWQCTKVGSCRCPRDSVLKGSPWYFQGGGGVPPRKVAILVLAHQEGLPRKSAAAIAGVDETAEVCWSEGTSDTGQAAG